MRTLRQEDPKLQAHLRLTRRLPRGRLLIKVRRLNKKLRMTGEEERINNLGLKETVHPLGEGHRLPSPWAWLNVHNSNCGSTYLNHILLLGIVIPKNTEWYGWEITQHKHELEEVFLKQQKESHLLDGNSISTSLVRAENQPQQHNLNCCKIFNYSHKLARKLKLNVTQRNLYPANIFWLIILISSLLPLLKFDNEWQVTHWECFCI